MDEIFESDVVEETVEGSEVSVVDALVEELLSSPEKALVLTTALSRITKPWEALTSGNATSTDMPMSPQQTVIGSGLIAGFRLATIFGDEVAVVYKDSPKWKVFIEGQIDPGSPMIQHAAKAEKEVKAYVEGVLKSRGFITH